MEMIFDTKFQAKIQIQHKAQIKMLMYNLEITAF